MHPHTANELAAHHEALSSFTSAFLFPTSKGPVNLGLGIGDGAVPLRFLPFQPDIFPPGTSYRFEMSKYRGLDAAFSILTDIANCIGDCFLHGSGSNVYADYTSFRLRCSFDWVARSWTSDNFSTTCFVKNNTVTEPIKRRGHSTETAVDRMYNHKMRHDKHRPESSSTDVSNDVTFSASRRTSGFRARTCLSRCPALITIRHYHASGCWYLAMASRLCHCNHLPFDPSYKPMRHGQTSELESSISDLLYQEGASLDVVTRCLNQIRKRSGKLTSFKKVTVRNLLRRNKLKLEFLNHVKPDWSTATKTLAYLQRNNISYIALVMDADDNLLVYKGKGRPTRAESESIMADGDLREHLAEIRTDLKVAGTSLVLLALSVATDAMIRAFHMFPEVQFLDVAANMNSQKRDMLFSVIKEGTGQCFVVNATALPCGRRWIFLKVYQSFFVYLYGWIAISRIELVITDDDLSSHGALADVKILDQCWSGVLHMLCVFHGLVMVFHKNIWPKLPHKEDNPYELTDTGRLYCESTKTPFFKQKHSHHLYPLMFLFH